MQIIFLNISKDLLSQLDAKCKFKTQPDFHTRAKLKYFSLKIIKFLYGNFLPGNAIMPDHFSSFSRPSSHVLLHYCLCIVYLCFCYRLLKFYKSEVLVKWHDLDTKYFRIKRKEPTHLDIICTTFFWSKTIRFNAFPKIKKKA